MSPEPKKSNGEQVHESGAQYPGIAAAIAETEITQRQARLKLESDQFEFQQRRAKLFAISGLFGGAKDQSIDQAIAQAMVRIELGESMGFGAAESLQGIDIINSRAAVSSALCAARMQAAGFGWDIEWHEDEKHECVGCTLWLRFKGAPLENHAGQQASVSYMKSDAERMLTTIWENNTKRRASILEKDNWKMTPRNMYFARTVKNAQRWYAPGVLSASILSIEEAMDLDTDSTPAAPKQESKPPAEQQGNKTLRGKLGVDKTPKEEQPSTQQTPPEASTGPVAAGSAAPGAASPDAPVEPIWSTVDLMHTGFRELRTEMQEMLGSLGAADFDSVMRDAGGMPKDVRNGMRVYQRIQNLFADLKKVAKRPL